MREIAAYVSRAYTYGGDIRWSIENEKKYTVVVPEDIDATSSSTDKRIWEKRIDKYVKRDLELNENCDKLYSLIFGQCTHFTRTKLKSINDYKSIKQGFDAIKLINAIKSLTCQFKGQKYHHQALCQAKRIFYIFHQGKAMMNAKSLESFQTLVSVIEEYVGEIGHDPCAIATTLEGK
jgi:hypothetical protein